MGRKATASDGFGRQVILGLLAEGPSNCYQLDSRLLQRFHSSDYSRGMASTTMRRLVRDKLARPVEGGGMTVEGSGGRDSVVLFEATPAGIERFRAWMWSSVATPVVREELHAKIALCQPSDLPRMITLVRQAETVCVGKLQDLNRDLQTRRGDLDPDLWVTRMDLAVSTGDQAWWESRISWLQRVHLFLEKEWQRYQEQLRARPALRRTA